MVFLFNVGGYGLVFWLAERHANQKLESRLNDNQYEDTETVLLKIPIDLPYPITQNDYERVTGDFEYEGQFYTMVKQKIENNTLFLVCVKNTDATHLAVVKKDYTALANDVKGESKSPLNNLLAKMFKDFSSAESLSISMASVLLAEYLFTEPAISLSIASYAIDSPPPESHS